LNKPTTEEAQATRPEAPAALLAPPQTSADYRFYFCDASGSIYNAVEDLCAGDEAAGSRAEELLSTGAGVCAIEVWQRSRLVARRESAETPPTTTSRGAAMKIMLRKYVRRRRP
jgi:hypothetical protein